MKHSLLLITLLLAGCGPRLDVTVDGERQDFNVAVHIGSSQTVETGYRIVFSGESGNPAAADGTGAFSVTMELDPAALRNAPRNRPLQIAGVNHFDYPSNADGTFPSFTYELTDAQIHFTAASTHDPTVVRLWARASCFCSRYRFEPDQNVAGTVTVVSDPESARLRGSIHLSFEGSIPFWHGGGVASRSAVVDSDFDVTAPR